MISEPELHGEQGDAWSAPALADSHAGGSTPGPTPEQERDHGHEPETIAGSGIRRPAPLRRAALLGTLGGALMASAGWAAGLYVYNSSGPDLQGYRVSHDLCRDAALTGLSGVLGTKRSPHSAVSEAPALDRSICSVDLGPSPDGQEDDPSHDSPSTTHSTVGLSYTLHRTSDPGPEFDATVTQLSTDDERYGKKPLTGLGERAYLVTSAEGNTTRLKVLDGQAELTIDVSSFTEYGHGPGAGNQYMVTPVDLTVVEPALIHDARDLMEALSE